MHDNQLGKEFKNEILTMSKIEHLNLVRLYGFVEHRDERVIIVEFVGNGTLREHLDGKLTRLSELLITITVIFTITKYRNKIVIF